MIKTVFWFINHEKKKNPQQIASNVMIINRYNMYIELCYAARMCVSIHIVKLGQQKKNK